MAETPIEKAPRHLSARLRSALHRTGLKTFEEIAAQGPKWFKGILGVGPTTMIEMENHLLAIGLPWEGTEVVTPGQILQKVLAELPTTDDVRIVVEVGGKRAEFSTKYLNSIVRQEPDWPEARAAQAVQMRWMPGAKFDDPFDDPPQELTDAEKAAPISLDFAHHDRRSAAPQEPSTAQNSSILARISAEADDDSIYDR